MPKIALVCSSGGHLFQLYSLQDFWREEDRFWVTFPTPDAKYLVSDEHVYWAHHPTNRNLPNFIRNLRLAIEVLRKERPGVIVSTGAGLAVPFVWIGWLLNIRTIYIESITRNQQLSLSARLIYYVVDVLLVQWPELAQKYRRARYEGRIV